MELSLSLCESLCVCASLCACASLRVCASLRARAFEGGMRLGVKGDFLSLHQGALGEQRRFDLLLLANLVIEIVSRIGLCSLGRYLGALQRRAQRRRSAQSAPPPPRPSRAVRPFAPAPNLPLEI